MGKLALPLAATLLLSACGEEGVLLRVRTTDAALATSLDDVELFLATRTVDGDPSLLVRNSDPADRIDLNGRNLLDDPLDVWFGSDVPTPLAVSVVGFDRNLDVAPRPELTGDDRQAVAHGAVMIRDVSDGGVVRYEVLLTAQAVDVWGGSDTGRCLRWIDENGDEQVIGPDGNSDCDPVGNTEDCRPGDPFITTGIAGLDEDCDGLCDQGTDPDGDGFTASYSGYVGHPDGNGNCVVLREDSSTLADCKPLDAAVHPWDGVAAYTGELLNAVDDNCDGVCDEAFDLDEDGFTIEVEGVIGSRSEVDNVWHCEVPNTSRLVDCDDDDDQTYPGAVDDQCDGEDRNCDFLDYLPADDFCVVDDPARCRAGRPICFDGAMECYVKDGAADIALGETSCDQAAQCDLKAAPVAACVLDQGSGGSLCPMSHSVNDQRYCSTQPIVLDASLPCDATIYSSLPGVAEFANGQTTSSFSVCSFTVFATESNLDWDDVDLYVVADLPNEPSPTSRRAVRIQWVRVSASNCDGVPLCAVATN